MAVRSRTRARPVACEAVAVLASIPAGPALAAALAGLDVTAVSGFEAVLVLRAQSRQVNHERGLLARSVVEVLRRRDSGHGITQGWQSGDLVGSAEVRAALVLTRPAAKDLCAVSRDLYVRLPAVLDALVAGVIDDARARIFSTWTSELCQRHAHALVERLLPTAAKLTVAELITAIQKAAIELDPEWAGRRYERGLGQRRVQGKLRPDGTADLAGFNLPAGGVAIACGRLDTLAHRLKQAGYPDTLDHIRTEVFLGKLGGRFTYLDDDEIFDVMLMSINPPPDPESTMDAPDGEEGGGEDDEDGDDPDGSGGSPAPDGPPEAGGGGGVAEPRARAGVTGRAVQVLAGLATIAGCDRRPGEVLGWGFVPAEVARELAAAPGASWWYAVTRPDGTPLHVGPVRTRPTRPCTDTPPTLTAGVEVWLHLTPDELTALVHDPPSGWARVITDLAHRIATSPGGAPNHDPTARLPGAALRRWIGIRDRRCVFPGCRIAPHRCDADHTIEHAHGGPTIDANLANACQPDHQLRHRGGWRVRQPRPGHIIWTSPLGHEYERTPPPGPDHTYPPMPEPIHPDEDIDAQYYTDDREDEDVYYRGDTCKVYDPTPRRRPPTPRPEPPPRPPSNPDDDIPPF